MNYCSIISWVYYIADTILIVVSLLLSKLNIPVHYSYLYNNYCDDVDGQKIAKRLARQITRETMIISIGIQLELFK